MKTLFGMSAVAALLAVSPASAQNAAYPTPDNNLTRSDDVDPSEAPYLNEEQGRPSTSSDYYVAAPEDPDVDDGSDGGSSGEAGADYPPPLPPGYHYERRD